MEIGYWYIWLPDGFQSTWGGDKLGQGHCQKHNHSTKKASNHHANLPLEMYSFTL